MKHWPRTTGLSFQSMHENMGAFNRVMPIDVVYTETKSMVADIHTKHFANPEQWNHARRLCGVFESYEELDTQIQTHFEWFSSLLTTYEESKVNKYGRVKSENEESDKFYYHPENPQWKDQSQLDEVYMAWRSKIRNIPAQACATLSQWRSSAVCQGPAKIRIEKMSFAEGRIPAPPHQPNGQNRANLNTAATESASSSSASGMMMPQAPAVLIANTDVHMAAAETADTCNEEAVSEYSYESFSSDEEKPKAPSEVMTPAAKNEPPVRARSDTIELPRRKSWRGQPQVQLE